MASMGVGHLDPEPVTRLVRGTGMLNRHLQAICKAESLPHSGNKAELQIRICDNIRRYAATGDLEGLQRIKTMVENPDHVQLQQANQRFGLYSSSPSAPSPRSMANNYNTGFPMVYRGGLMNIHFKPSPFYTLQQQLGETRMCDIMENHRHTVGIRIKPMDYPILRTVQIDRSFRIMIFSCEMEDGRALHDVAFPHQSEIKVNGGEIKANLRGLKNKPGSTRPVDITDTLRLRQEAYDNNVEMTYALTKKAGTDLYQKYYLMVYVVKTVPVAELVKILAGGKKISRDSIINEMVTKARDPDIVATSTVLSLKCPLSYSRISLPCRSISCRHNQCFDATSYLQLQEQGPTWLCPVCNISAPFESLAVDEYVRNILMSTSRLVDQVTIEPDGRWSQHGKLDSLNGNDASIGSDEELVEIKDTRVSALKMASTPVPSINSTWTPLTFSRELSASTAPPQGTTSGKRPISQVIDLTLSDDEDDEPIARAPKRQFTGYSTPQSMLAGRNGQSSS